MGIDHNKAVLNMTLESLPGHEKSIHAIAQRKNSRFHILQNLRPVRFIKLLGGKILFGTSENPNHFPDLKNKLATLAGEENLTQLP